MTLEESTNPKPENNSELESILPEEPRKLRFSDMSYLEAGILGGFTGMAIYGAYFAGIWFFSR